MNRGNYCVIGCVFFLFVFSETFKNDSGKDAIALTTLCSLLNEMPLWKCEYCWAILCRKKRENFCLKSVRCLYLNRVTYPVSRLTNNISSVCSIAAPRGSRPKKSSALHRRHTPKEQLLCQAHWLLPAGLIFLFDRRKKKPNLNGKCIYRSVEKTQCDI